jgi:putative FmdB family regulatory protein
VPLYEYQCKKDGRFELIRRFSDPPLKKCPTCGGPIEKLVAAPAIQFKGSGWYVTDYAKKSGGDAKNGDSKASDSKASDSKSSDSKSSDSSASKDAKSSTPSTSTKDSSATKGSSAS